MTDLLLRTTTTTRTPMAWLSRWREDGIVSLFTLGLCVLLGAPAGLVWTALAPHAAVVINANGANFADGVTEDFIGADVWFAAVVVVFGIVTGVLAWWQARGAGPFVVLALAAGGLLAALVASHVGTLPGKAALQAAASAGRAGDYTANVALQARLLLLLWPTAALAAFLALVLSKPDDVV